MCFSHNSQPSRASKAAFSLMEALVVIAVVGIIGAVAFVGVNRFKDSAAHTKLDSDITTVNMAVKVYLANGGDLSGVTVPQEILDKLKTTRTAEDAAKFAGLRSSMIDKRLVAVLQTASESAAGEPRAVWNATKNQFEAATSGANGVKAFRLDQTLATVDYGTEAREGSVINYNTGNGWIWTFVETPGAPPPGPDDIPSGGGGDPPPPPPPGGTTRLSPPSISPPGGQFPYTDFPISATISHSNSPSVSELYWATEWSGGTGINWQLYSGPISIQPDQQLLAYVKSTSPDYLDSYSVGANFVSEDVPLDPPTIAASAPYLDLETNAPVTITLTDPNPTGSTLEYRMAGGTWVPYSGPFDVSPAAYSGGFTVEGRAVPATQGYSTSSTASLSLPIKLKMPEIVFSDPAFTQTITSITVTLNNPNPASSSHPKYQIENLDDGSTSNWLSYSNSFTLDSTTYPEGFKITTHSYPDQSNYMQSDDTELSADGFFGTGIDGFTLLVLDTSGSMNWNNRLGQVKTEVVNALNNYPASGKFGIIEFSGSASVVYPWSEATPANVAAAITAVNALNAGGSTNYSDALDEALSIIQAEGDVNQVIFLSDGKPTSGDKSTSGILNRVSLIAAEGPYLDTIGFQINQSGQVLLQSMANTGNGTFTQVD